jgi:hypothetical protein
MIREAVVRFEAAQGRRASRATSGAIACGLCAFALCVATGRVQLALATLAASWLFFAGLAAGSLAVLAAIRLARGRWAASVLPIAAATVGFLDYALVLLVVLIAGARSLLPWAADAGLGRVALLALRELVPTAALVAAGGRLVGTGRRGVAREKGTAAAVVYLVTYAVALSFWAFDWVLSLTSAPPPTVLPAFYFMGAFLSGIAWVALVAAARGAGGAGVRHDLGKLLFGFATIWAYLLWAIYLAAWYGNVPAEVAPLLARWTGAWRPVSAAVLLAVFVGPFFLLLPERTKRGRGTLLGGAAAVLAGLLAEGVLLVLPSLELPADVFAVAAGAGIVLGVAGLFALGVGARIPLSAPDAGPPERPGVRAEAHPAAPFS